MNQLPQQFLIVNHEGLHRAYITLEPVSDFGNMVAKFSHHKMLVARNLGYHPYGILHLGIHSRDGASILILEANKGMMGLQTQYHLVQTEKYGEWISPCFVSSNQTANPFELRCEFDFQIWAQSGLKMFFAINSMEGLVQLWAGWERQNYRAPFGNIFETGSICTGISKYEDFFTIPMAGLDKLLTHLSASVWNADAFDSRWIVPISQLVRFDAKSLKMLPPLRPESIVKLGVMAHANISDLTKLIYG